MPVPSDKTYRRLRALVAIDESAGAPRDTLTINEVFTGRPLADVPIGTKEDTLAAIERARHAQVDWAARPLAERAKILGRVADLALKRRDDVMDVLQAETGKARSGALEEILDTTLTYRYYAVKGPKFLAPQRAQGMFPVLTKTTVHHHPKGVVGMISPWNYPLALTANDAVGALMAGNAVVVKPDSQTPFTALIGAELLYEAGVPRDVFQIVTGPGRVVGDTLARSTDFLMFTGSSATGAALGAIAGKRLISYSAELGGKNAMIVTRGANLEKAASVATHALYANAGQLCVSVERIYVERSVAAEFETLLAKKINAMSLRADYSMGTDMGSLISADQLTTVSEHVEDAVAKGARVITGGRARPDLGPYFYEPTLLTDVPDTAVASCNETFGPVVSLYPVDSIEEAIARANDTDYGLNSSVFAATTAQGEAIARQLRTGTVNVNEGFVAAWASVDAPMGGMGISGVGRRHGKEGVLKYTEAQTVATQRLISFTGPSFLSKKTWFTVLPKVVPLLRLFPGR